MAEVSLPFTNFQQIIDITKALLKPDQQYLIGCNVDGSHLSLLWAKYNSNGTWTSFRSISDDFIEQGDEICNCVTPSSNKIKEVISENFIQEDGKKIVVIFENTNTAIEPKLKVNDNKRAPIYYKNTPIDSSYLLSGYRYKFQFIHTDELDYFNLTKGVYPFDLSSTTQLFYALLNFKHFNRIKWYLIKDKIYTVVYNKYDQVADRYNFEMNNLKWSGSEWLIENEAEQWIKISPRDVVYAVYADEDNNTIEHMVMRAGSLTPFLVFVGLGSAGKAEVYVMTENPSGELIQQRVRVRIN